MILNKTPYVDCVVWWEAACSQSLTFSAALPMWGEKFLTKFLTKIIRWGLRKSATLSRRFLPCSLHWHQRTSYGYYYPSTRTGEICLRPAFKSVTKWRRMLFAEMRTSVIELCCIWKSSVNLFSCLFSSFCGASLKFLADPIASNGHSRNYPGKESDWIPFSCWQLQLMLTCLFCNRWG